METQPTEVELGLAVKKVSKYHAEENYVSAFVLELMARYRWVLGAGKRLDLDAMAAAARVLVGTHDFSTFGVRMPTDPREPVKVMRRLEVRRHLRVEDPVRAAASSAADAHEPRAGGEHGPADNESVVTICAECDRFLYNMMRLISGTLVQVGLGKLRADEVSELLAARGRAASGGVFKAPAQGLCLERCFLEGVDDPWPERGDLEVAAGGEQEAKHMKQAATPLDLSDAN